MRSEKPNARKRAKLIDKTTSAKRVVSPDKSNSDERVALGDKAKHQERVAAANKSASGERVVLRNKTTLEERAKEVDKSNLNERGDSLITLVDDVLGIEKIRVREQVRLSHLIRNRFPETIEAKKALSKAQLKVLRYKVSPRTAEVFDDLEAIEKKIDSWIASDLETHPAYPWFSRVKGIGKENIAKVIALIDINKADTISSLWAYCGLTPDSKKVKGEKLAFNSTLRVMQFRLSTSLLKAGGKYYSKYLEYKEFYQKRCERDGIKIVSAEKLPVKNGKRYEPEGMMSEGHIHFMALRKMSRLFLAHLYVSWKEAIGQPARPPYLEEAVWCPNCNTPTHFHTIKKEGKFYICPKCKTRFEGQIGGNKLISPLEMCDR